VNNGNMEFEIKLKMNSIQHNDFEVISVVTRNFQFKYDVFQIMMSIQDSLSLRVVKKIILWKPDFKNTWMKYLLNEALYT
jgi:hypothetical protein